MTNVRIRLPDGAVYETTAPEREPVAKAAARSREALDADRRRSQAAATSADLARLGAAVVKGRLARQEVVKELEAAAERWEKQAAALPYATGNEYQEYLKTKARNARQRAKQLREGKA